jgi:hypothetical protein
MLSNGKSIDMSAPLYCNRIYILPSRTLVMSGDGQTTRKNTGKLAARPPLPHMVRPAFTVLVYKATACDYQAYLIERLGLIVWFLG